MYEYNFDAKKATENILDWTRKWFERNGKDKNVVIGMSGGKDSTITAALLAEALGRERVIGVSMPDKNQSINEADEICEYLGIKYINFPIGEITKKIKGIYSLEMATYNVKNDTEENICISEQSSQNIPPRVRMTVLYAIAQSNNAFVVNNCNLSEDFIGYSTKFGDAVGDFSLLSNYTVTEILEIGDYLGLPDKWVHKTPDDGLPHSKPDEEKFGFTYEELDKFIRKYRFDTLINEQIWFKGNTDVEKKIINMHNYNLHKMLPMPKAEFNKFLYL